MEGSRVEWKSFDWLLCWTYEQRDPHGDEKGQDDGVHMGDLEVFLSPSFGQCQSVANIKFQLYKQMSDKKILECDN